MGSAKWNLPEFSFMVGIYTFIRHLFRCIWA